MTDRSARGDGGGGGRGFESRPGPVSPPLLPTPQSGFARGTAALTDTASFLGAPSRASCGCRRRLRARQAPVGTSHLRAWSAMAASGPGRLWPPLINPGLMKEFVGKTHMDQSSLVQHKEADRVKKALYHFALGAEKDSQV